MHGGKIRRRVCSSGTLAARSAAHVQPVVRWLKKKTLAKVGELTGHPQQAISVQQFDCDGW